MTDMKKHKTQEIKKTYTWIAEVKEEVKKYK